MEYRILTKRKNGEEPFIGINQTLLDYWQWAHSDIASNAERGKLAEFIVKCAVDAPSPCRIEWDAVDIISPDGVKIEVKSSAYLQSWKCPKLSTIQFDVAPKKSWNSESNQYSETIGRNSDVYVFCLFSCQNPNIADPLNLSQWDFYVLRTNVLDEKIPNQKTIGLTSLVRLGAEKVSYFELATAIKDATTK